jgi:hypothetical protein
MCVGHQLIDYRINAMPFRVELTRLSSETELRFSGHDTGRYGIIFIRGAKHPRQSAALSSSIKQVKV